MTSRVVALIDMDCFYCQVETRLRPELIGTPVAVVQYKTWKGGGIIAVNYEARAAGVTRFMRGDEAKATCPSITLCSVPEVRGKAGLTRYRNAGREVIQVFSEFCRCVERASVDEAFIDLTDVVEKRMDKPVTPEQLPNTFVVGFSPPGSNEHVDGQKGVKEWLFSLYDSELDDVNTKKLAVGAAVIEEIRAAVYEKTGFRCSAGIAHNKIIAKLAAGLHKPNRQTVLPQSGVPILFKELPVKKVRNLGGKLGLAVMEQLGCKVMGDLMAFSLKDLQQRFDEKSGTWLYNIVRGIDHEPVAARLLPKSIGCSKRFPGNSALGTLEDVWHWLGELSSEISERLKDDQILNERTGKALTVMGAFRTDDGKWSSFTRSGPLHSYDEDKIIEASMSLIKKSNTASAISGAWSPPLINLGLSVAKFIDTPPGFNKIRQFFSAPSSSRSVPEKKDLPKFAADSNNENIANNERSVDNTESEISIETEGNTSKSTFVSESFPEEKSNLAHLEASNVDRTTTDSNPVIRKDGDDVKQWSNQQTQSDRSKKESGSILHKYFKKNVKKNAGRSENIEIYSNSNNEESDTSKDGFEKVNNSETKSILINENEKGSILQKYFKKNRSKNSGRSEDIEINSNNEESDTSKDGFQNFNNSEVKSILISGNEKFRESIEAPPRNFTCFLDRESLDRPSTSFFQPNGNSTTLETSESNIESTTLKDVSDHSNGPSVDTDDSNDCWRTVTEIFPDLDNIDLDVFQLLPKKLQDILYGSKYGKKLIRNSGKPQIEERCHVKPKNKLSKGKSGKNTTIGKDLGHKGLGDTTLSQYFFRADGVTADSSKKSEFELNTASSKTLSEYFVQPNLEEEVSSKFDSHSTKKGSIESICEEENITDRKELPEIDGEVRSKDNGNTKDDGTEFFYKAEGETKDDEIVIFDEVNEDEETFVSSCDLFEAEENDAKSIGENNRDLFEKSSIIQNVDSSPCRMPGVSSVSALPACNKNEKDETCIDIFSETEPNDDFESSESLGFNLGQEIRQENDSQIVDRLTPVVLSDQTVDLSTKKCSLCDESIIVAAMSEHLDYHAALSLHKELNSMSESTNLPAVNHAFSANSSAAESSIASKSTGGKVSSTSGNTSLKRKKNQPAKSSKKSMNIASFFSSR